MELYFSIYVVSIILTNYGVIPPIHLKVSKAWIRSKENILSHHIESMSMEKPITFALRHFPI